MALNTRHNSIKLLRTAFPRGTPFDHRELAKVGVSSALAHHYLKSGWLVRLGRGVFMFPNDTLRREDCLKFLSRRVLGFHVGGKTALAWRGSGCQPDANDESPPPSHLPGDNAPWRHHIHWA